MASVCKVILLGNLTREPEMRYAPTGTAICSFGMAMNHKYGDKEETCFLDVTAFGKLGELASQYLAKGRQAYVEGRLRLESWERDGQKRSKHTVIADTIQFLGSKGEADTPANRPAPPHTPPIPPTTAAPERAVGDEDDDIPFIRGDIADERSLSERRKFMA